MSQLAQVLEQHEVEVVQRWVARVREHLAPGGESPAELEDHIPLFLRQLQRVLRGESSGDRTSPEAGTNRVGREHGAQRFQLGFSLGALVREYGVLRDVLLDLIDEERLQVPLAEVRLLTDFVATAIAEAVEEHGRQQEHARREANEIHGARLKALFQQAPLALGVLRGPEAIIEVANPLLCRLWGRTPEQLLGRPVRDALPEPWGLGLDEAVRRVMATGEPFVVTESPVALPREAEEPRSFSFVYNALRDEHGHLEGIILVATEVTEAVRARQQLQAALERSREAEASRTALLDALAAQNLVAVNYLRGPQHVFERANPLYVQTVDREVLGQPFLQALPELEAQGVGRLMDETFQTGTPLIQRERPLQVRGRNGTLRERLFDFVLQPVRDAQGRVEGILNLAIDATEHVHARQVAQGLVEQERTHRDAEQQLRLQAEGERARLNALFQQAPMAITVLRGPELLIEIANRGILRIWGRDAGQVVGRPLLDALPEMRGQGFEALLLEVLRTGEPFVAMEMEIQFARGEGGALETGYFNFVYEPLRDEQGRPEAVIAIATEVSEAVRARQEVEVLLQRSQEAERARAALLDALSAQSLVAVSYLHGPDHVTHTVNAPNRQMAGRDAMGLPYRVAFPELDQQGFTRLLDRVRETGEPLVGRESVLQLAETAETPAHELILDYTYQPVRAPDGGVEGILTLALDVTPLVLLRRSAEGLAQEERRLRDFEQHLIGIVSHDLRNPLSAILLNTQVMLRREELDTRTLHSLLRLQASAERAVRMVRDLLDFTQARLGGGLKVERAPGDVHALVRGVVEEFLVTHPTRELRLEQSGDGRGAWDADRVAQLLGNLVTNALKYSPADTPVTVRSTGGPGEVRLEVHNGGTPISPEALPLLFQPLQRAGGGIDHATRSVGLGLYIVDQLARAHGGDVQVTSSAGAGTRFTVRLPRGG